MKYRYRRPLKYRPSVEGIIAVVVIAVMFIIMGCIEAWPNDTVIINVPEPGESSTIMTNNDDGGSTIIHCFTGESGLTICQEL